MRERTGPEARLGIDEPGQKVVEEAEAGRESWLGDRRWPNGEPGSSGEKVRGSRTEQRLGEKAGKRWRQWVKNWEVQQR